MSTKNHFIAAILWIALGTVAFAQDSTSRPTPPNPRDFIKFQTRRTPNPTAPAPELKSAIDKFFTALKAGETTKAYEDLLQNTRLAERKDNLRVFVEKTDQALGLYGKVINFEVYDNYTVGSSLMVLTYISMHPVQPLRWRLVYYKPEKAWTLIDVRVDDVLEDLID